MGIAMALTFCNMGAAYDTAKAGVGLASMGVLNPAMVNRNLLPIIMAGILGIYGLIMGVTLQGKVQEGSDAHFSAYSGYCCFAAGAVCGLSSLAAGIPIGVAGDAGVRAVGQQPRLFNVVTLIMIFSEALGLYGLIVAIVVTGSVNPSTDAQCQGCQPGMKWGYDGNTPPN